MSTCAIDEVDLKRAVQTFLDEVEHAIGAEHVVRKTSEVATLAIDPVFTTVPPQGFVYPSSTAEVSEIVRLANEYGVKLWPYSTERIGGIATRLDVRIPS